MHWSAETSHMESMLELDEHECVQIRCVSIFCKRGQERGKHRSGPHFNYKNLSISMGRWENELAENRCATPRAKAAQQWLYANNMTYRHYYDMHRSVLCNYRSNTDGSRKTLYLTTYDLLYKSPGIEVAAWPILYPWSRYGDTDVRDRLSDGGSGTEAQHYSGKTSFIRKLLSRCRGYEQESFLMFYLHDRFLTKTLFAKSTVADNRRTTADITGQSTIISDSYWRAEQAYSADLVRQMARRCRDALPGDPIWEYQHKCSIYEDTEMDKSLAFPNLFITIAPAEWLFPMHCSQQSYYESRRGHDIAGASVLHMYYAIKDTILVLLTEKSSY